MCVCRRGRARKQERGCERDRGRGRGREKEINGKRERVVEKGERVGIGVHVCVYGNECV